MIAVTLRDLLGREGNARAVGGSDGGLNRDAENEEADEGETTHEISREIISGASEDKRSDEMRHAASGDAASVVNYGRVYRKFAEACRRLSDKPERFRAWDLRQHLP